MNPLILTFLLQLGCVPTAEVVVDPTMKVMEFYKDGTVYLRPGVPDSVIVHGLWHDCQYQKYGGRAQTDYQWIKREAEAIRVERMWREGIFDGVNINNDWR